MLSYIVEGATMREETEEERVQRIARDRAWYDAGEFDGFYPTVSARRVVRAARR